MNILNLLDAKLGGRERAIAMTILTIALYVVAVIGAIDWQAPIAASIPTIIQILTHGTPLGNKEAK